MLDDLLAINDMRLITYIDNSAYSAAALLAYGHEEIYMRREAAIGDIGVIFRRLMASNMPQKKSPPLSELGSAKSASYGAGRERYC